MSFYADSSHSETKKISRREFLERLGLLSAFAAAYPASVLAELRQNNTSQSSPDWLNESAWKTIASVQETLFPAAEDMPGARDIGAIQYLHKAIENPHADGEDRDFILRGVGWLDELAQQRYTRNYIQLTAVEQEKIIQETVQTRAGRNWVSMLLTYILEALLCEPVYLGNPDGIGWSWLQHQPGFPTPSADKTWDRLLQRRA